MEETSGRATEEVSFFQDRLMHMYRAQFVPETKAM